MREWYRCIFDVDNTYACVRSNEKGKRARDCRRQPEVGWSSNRRRPIYIFLWLLYTTWQREIVDRPTCVCRTNPQNPVVCFACGFYKYREKTSLSGISDDQTKKANDMLHTQHPRFFDPAAGCVRYDRKDFLFFQDHWTGNVPFVSLDITCHFTWKIVIHLMLARYKLCVQQ